MAVYSGARVVI